MSVSSLSSAGTSAAYATRRHHHHHSARSAAADTSADPTGSTGSTSTADPAAPAAASGTGSGPPPGPPPAGGQAPGGPGGGGRLAKFEDILKNGGGVDDLKAEADKEFDAFKSSDKFKSLSADQQQAIQDRHDSSAETDRLQSLVDRYQKTGSLKPPEQSDGGEASGRALAELQHRGRARRAEVYSKFGVGGSSTNGGGQSDGESSAAADASADVSSL